MRTIAVGVLAALLSVSAPWTTAFAAGCPGPESLPVVGGEPLSDLDDLIDRTVAGSDGHTLGTVWDVTLDRCNTPQDIVLNADESGRKVSIPIERIRTVTDDNRLVLKDVTNLDVASLPSVHTDADTISLARGH